MNLNEQLRQAYNAGRRQGLNENIAPIQSTPDGYPIYKYNPYPFGGPPIPPGTPPDDGDPPGGNPRFNVREPGELLPDGSILFPDGSILFPDDHRLYPGGTYFPGPPEYVKYPNGRIQYLGPIA